MAVKKKQTLTPSNAIIVEKALEQIESLLTEHVADAMEVLEDSEDHKVNIALGVSVNCAESIGKVKTKIRFSATCTDERDADIDDPKQLKLPGTDAEKKGGKGGGKNKTTEPEKIGD